MDTNRRAWDSGNWTPATGDWYLPHTVYPGMSQHMGNHSVMRQDPGYLPFRSIAFPDAGYGYPYGSDYPRRRRYVEMGGYSTNRVWRERRPRDAPPFCTIPLAVRGIPETENIDWFYGRGGQLHYF